MAKERNIQREAYLKTILNNSTLVFRRNQGEGWIDFDVLKQNVNIGVLALNMADPKFYDFREDLKDYQGIAADLAKQTVNEIKS